MIKAACKFILGIVLLTCFVTPAMASSVGAPSQNLEQLSFSVSAMASFAMREVHLVENENKSDDAFHSRLAVKALFSPLRWLDVYGSIGTADWRMEDPDYNSVLGIFYGGGVRVRLFPWFWQEDGLFNVELDGQLSALSSKSGDVDRSAFGNEADMEYWEYQISLIVSKRFEFFVPYGGLCYDRAGVEFSPGGSSNVESDFHWGVFLGIDYFVTPLVFFSAELHIFTETSLYLGVGFAY